MAFCSYLCIRFTFDFTLVSSFVFVRHVNLYSSCREVVAASTGYHSCTISHCVFDWVRAIFSGVPEQDVTSTERSVGVFDYERFDRGLWRGGYPVLQRLSLLLSSVPPGDEVLEGGDG